MKEHLRHLVSRLDNDIARACLIREYLQARVLETLQDAGVFRTWAFVGGTALRFLFDIQRFSEDLDFSLVAPSKDAGFRPALVRVKHAFAREAYGVDVKVREAKAVASAWIRFPGLPHELRFSPHTSETLSIKLELDTNPPAGAHTETSIVRRHVTVRLCHHDKASLFAGKLHAVFSRPWTKGRDIYDLIWYLTDPTWPPPNLELLNNALSQTGWRGAAMTNANWRNAVRSRLDTIDWQRAQADVRPFLERERDRGLVTRETLAELLGR